MSSRIGQPGRGCCGAGRCQFAFSAFFLVAALCMAGIAVSFHYESEEDPRAKRVAEYDDVVSAWTGTHRAAYASKWQGASSTPNFTITRGTTDDPSPVAGTFDENTSGGLGLDTSSQTALGQYGADVGKYSQGMIVKAKLQGFHTNPYKTEDEFQITLGSIAGGNVRTIRAKAYRCEVADYREGTTKKPRHMYHAVPMHLEQVTLVEKSNDADEGVETTLPACPYRWAKKLATPAAHLNNYKAAKADCDAIGRIPLVNADVEIVIRSPNDPYIAAATIAAKYGGAGGEPGCARDFGPTQAELRTERDSNAGTSAVALFLAFILYLNGKNAAKAAMEAAGGGTGADAGVQMRQSPPMFGSNVHRHGQYPAPAPAPAQAQAGGGYYAPFGQAQPQPQPGYPAPPPIYTATIQPHQQKPHYPPV